MFLISNGKISTPYHSPFILELIHGNKLWALNWDPVSPPATCYVCYVLSLSSGYWKTLWDTIDFPIRSPRLVGQVVPFLVATGRNMEILNDYVWFQQETWGLLMGIWWNDLWCCVDTWGLSDGSNYQQSGNMGDILEIWSIQLIEPACVYIYIYVQVRRWSISHILPSWAAWVK